MIFFKILGWIILGIIILVLLVLSLKIRIEIEYSDENTSAVLKVLFLKIPLYPTKKKKTNKSTGEKKNSQNSDVKKNKPKNDESSKVVTEEKAFSESKEETEITEVEIPAEKKPSGKKKSGIKDLLMTLYNAEGIDGLTLIARRTADYFKTFFGGLLRWVVIEEFYLEACCTRSDAASTAIYYGEVCSALFPFLGSLVSKCKVKQYDINIYPDYIARFSSASFVVKLYFIPLVLIGHVIALLLKLLFRVVLQLIVKIFLYLKGNKNTGNDNKKSIEKSEITNE